MEFCTKEHEAFFNDHKDIAERGHDYAALVYTLGINSECREHFQRLYNDGINPDALRDSWQTGASTRITRLAFNLFTWHIAAGDDPTAYTPINLLSGLDDDQRRGAIAAIALFA